MPIILIGLLGAGAYLLWKHAHPEAPVVSVTPAPALPPAGGLGVPPPAPPVGIPTTAPAIPATTQPTSAGDLASQAAAAASQLPPIPADPSALLQQLQGFLGSFGVPGTGGIPTQQTSGYLPGEHVEEVGYSPGLARHFHPTYSYQAGGMPEITGAIVPPDVQKTAQWALTSASPTQLRSLISQFGRYPGIRAMLNTRLQQLYASGIW